MFAKKSYGQHFLNNEQTAERIANSLQLQNAYSTLLEVGPGRGMLTKYLMQRPEKLLMVEADKDMVLYLNKHYPSLQPNIIPADFMKVQLRELIKEPYAVIGNFPYNISSQIVFKVVENRLQIPEMVGMFQKEMAERIIAPPGNKTYGVISVLTQAFYEGTYLFTVNKGQFTPPPKVQSAVIRLVRKEQTTLDCDEKLFRRVVKTAFSQRRKMLRNTMKSIIPNHDILQESLFEKRPEKLSVADFIELTKTIHDILEN